MEKKLTVNKSKGKTADCTCRVCKHKTKHTIVTEATLRGSTGIDENEVNWMEEYQVVRCNGCETITFRQLSSNDQDYIRVGKDEWILDEQEDIYPSPYQKREPLEGVSQLPDKIQKIYIETLSTLHNKQEVLCGIGVRAIIETICKDKKSPGKNLYQKVDGLQAQGVLTQDGVNILHQLRTLGNNAAHEVKPHTQIELSLCFDVIEHLMLGVYILPAKTKQTFK